MIAPRAPSIIADRHDVREPVVALTFDDGPSEWTEPILDLLQEHRARATFFVSGNALPGREAVVQRIVREGSELGNHAFSHRLLTSLSDREIRQELQATGEALREITPAPVRFWRPPYFRYDERVDTIASELGYPELAWFSIYPSDYCSVPNDIVNRVLTELRPGSIVDLHDGRPKDEDTDFSAPTREATVEALAGLLEAISSRGYRAVTMSELMEAV